MLNVDGWTDARTDERMNGRTYERANGRKLARLCLPAKAGATINNGTPHLKSLKSRLGTASNKIAGGLELVCGRPTLALASVLVNQTKQVQTTKTKRLKHKKGVRIKRSFLCSHIKYVGKSQPL